MPTGIYTRTKYHREINRKAHIGQIWTEEQKNKARKGKTVTCPICNKLFYAKNSDLLRGNGKLCSKKCSGIAKTGENNYNWKGGRPTVQVKCQLCGKNFITRQSQVQRGYGKFCSYTCRTLYNLKHMPRKNTKIERIMAEALSRNGINFIPQEVINNFVCCDFYLPETNTVVFCDGKYWHSRPREQKRDPVVTQKLNMWGYRVIRFNEDEILSKLNKCIAQIKEEA